MSRTTASFFLLLYYNQVLGLPESWVGFGIMLALVADAVFDPVVGYVSLLLPLLFAFGTVTIALMIRSGILTSSMVADIVADSEVSTGRRSEGVLVAANSFV